MEVIQVGNTGFNVEAFADWTKEQFMEQYGRLPGADEAWRKIQKHKGSGVKSAPSASSTKPDEGKPSRGSRRNRN